MTPVSFHPQPRCCESRADLRRKWESVATPKRLPRDEIFKSRKQNAACPDWTAFAPPRRPIALKILKKLSGDMTLERVKHAEPKARPDSRAEIKRHPRDFIAPFGQVVGHDPARADVAKSLQRPQPSVTSGNIRAPTLQVHRHVDGHQKGQINHDADHGADENDAERTVEFG